MSAWDRKDFYKRVKRNGYTLARQTGSHRIFKNEDGRILPINGEPNKMVCRRLIKEYGLN